MTKFDLKFGYFEARLVRICSAKLLKITEKELHDFFKGYAQEVFTLTIFTFYARNFHLPYGWKAQKPSINKKDVNFRDYVLCLKTVHVHGVVFEKKTCN